MLAIITRVLIFIAVLSIITVLIPNDFVTQIDSALQGFAQNICALNLFINAQTVLTALTLFLDAFVGAIVFIIFVFFLRFSGGINK